MKILIFGLWTQPQYVKCFWTNCMYMYMYVCRMSIHHMYVHIYMYIYMYKYFQINIAVACLAVPKILSNSVQS